MNQKKTWMTGLLACLVAGSVSCGQPQQPQTPKPTPAPAPAPAPAAQPAPAPAAAEPPKADEPVKFIGPDGQQHTFPLDVYDENADANQLIAEGLAKAKREHKRVLAMWGENWCEFCIWLQDILLNDAGCKPMVQGDYVWVKIDLGKGFVKNTQLAEYYGIRVFDTLADGKQLGFPSLCVIDPETGRTVGDVNPKRGILTGVIGGNDMTAKPMVVGHLFDEKVIRQWLAENRAPAQAATAVMNEATATAKKEGKKVLALFTMPGCLDCDRASEWMGRPAVGAAMSSGLVMARIDIERMLGAREMLQEVAGKPVLPPLIAILDDQGKPLSKDAQFMALPKTDEQIQAFVKALSSAGKIGDKEQAVLTKSLKDAAAPKPEEKKP